MSLGNSEAMGPLQRLRSSLRWHHMEHIATRLWDAYAGLLCHQSMILALNSSFVDPLQQYETQLNMIESSFKTIFALPNFDEETTLWTNDEDVEDVQILYQNILNLFEDTLLILVFKDFYKLQILQEMMVWMTEDRSYLQQRVMLVICRVLSFASRKVGEYTSVDAPCLGILAAELALLCSHDDPSIVQKASRGMYHLLCVAKCQSGDAQTDKATRCFMSGKYNFMAYDSDFLPEILQQDKARIAESVGQNLLPSLVTDFVLHLLRKLSTSTPAPDIADRAATMLKLILKSHAWKVTRVCKMVDIIYRQLNENSSHIMKDAMLEIVTLLACTSPNVITYQFVDYPVPMNNTLIQMWKAVGSESSVAPQVLQIILMVLKDNPWKVEDTLTERQSFAFSATNIQPLAASQALCVLLPMSSYEKTVAQFFPELLMALLRQLFYTSQRAVMPQDRPLYAQVALRALLNYSGLHPVNSALKELNCWHKISEASYFHDGVNLIAKTLCDFNFPQFLETLQYLHKIVRHGPRRSEDHIITVIFFIEIMDTFKDPLPESFLALLRQWVTDSNPEINKLSLQKIASMAPAVSEIENAHGLVVSILDAFMSEDESVVTEALLTLQRIVKSLDKIICSSMCDIITSSYFHLMDHSHGSLQSLAIQHLGELFKDMSPYTSTMKRMIIRGFAYLLLGLEDEDIKVVKACRYTLGICDAHLDLSISSFLEGDNYSFEMVVLNVCSSLSLSHEKCITYLICDALEFLRSSQVQLRRGAIILLGYLAELGSHILFRDEVEVMTEAIEQMLQDEDPLIRHLAEITHNLLKKIASKMASSTIKQMFQRFSKFFYTKELKLLYNLPREKTSRPESSPS